MDGLEGLKNIVLRIAAVLGAKKRAMVMEKAKALKLRVLNPYTKG
jgi:ribosomal protein L32E